MKILYENCQPKDAEDKKLPYTSYLVEYLKDGTLHYDVAMGEKQVDIFDHYYDKYKAGLLRMDQTGGQMYPMGWNESMLNRPTRRTRKKPSKEEPVKEKKSEEEKE